MSALSVSPARTPPDLRLIAGLVFAAAIAWFQPFDVLFAAATLGQPVLRAAAIVVLALIGKEAGGVTGLPLHSSWRCVRVALLAAIAVAVGCALLDLLFRPVLHPGYVHIIAQAPLPVRTAGFMLRAINENVLYRLFLGSALAAALGQVWRTREGGPAEAAVWCGFALSQTINVLANVTLLGPLTWLTLVHDALRYFAPGMVWSWLYRRHGFVANEVASTSVHLLFQPLAGALLRG